ncbi:MAG: hypothetical protein AMS18_08870, partial [Gemmatimonas sp. SG8_17]
MELFRTATILMSVAAPSATATFAQYPDTYVLGKGVLRVSFEPWYINAKQRFDAGGTIEPLGTDLTRDSAGVNFFPSLEPAERAVQSITGDETFRINAGIFQTKQEADVRRFPFNFRLGLSNRLTLSASIPVVTTRSQVSFAVDEGSSSVGLNQVVDGAALQTVLALLSELEASASSLESMIAGNAFDCPSGPQCNSARDLVTRARALRADLMLLTGILGDGSLSPHLPPFAPLGISASGQAILAAIQSLSTELQSFGSPSITSTLPLPDAAVGSEDVNAVLTESLYGYEAAWPLDFIKRKEKLGDLEVGLRWGVAQGSSFRAVLSTTVRLPTGVRDQPDNFIDIGTGDKQTDVQFGLEAAVEPGSVVSLAVSGYYNLQLPDKLPRRLAPHTQPIQLAIYQLGVSRNLGDAFRVGAFPAIRLAQGFTTYGSIDYFRKGGDKYSLLDPYPTADGTGPTVEDLEFETGAELLSVGGGIHYRSTGRSGTSL